MRNRFFLAGLWLGGLSGHVYAEEISLVSGFYRSQDNTPGFKESKISLGGRYGFVMNEERRFWFIDAGVTSTSYSGDDAPKGGSGILLGGGQQYFFRNFGKAIHTFLAWSAGIKSDSSADKIEKTDTTALYYAGDAGFRFDYSKTFFMDIEAQLFESALNRTIKVTPNAGGDGRETKVTELQVASFNGANSLRFGLGMAF